MKILITGAASGIAYLTALTLAERKHEVYLTCHTNEQAKNVREKVKDYKNIKVMKIDITKEEDRQRVLNLNVDCLYNHAACALGGSIVEADMDKVRDNFEVNVFSSFRLLQLVLRQMIDKDRGRIVVMSSMAAVMPIPFGGIYSATKASISSIVNALKKELFIMGTNVSVALVEPGLYHTGFNDVFLDNKYNDGKYFKDVKDELYNVEHFLLRISEKKELDSIVVQIVRAIEDKKLKKVYRAPLSYALLGKIYGFFRA
ncbi:MAG: SDR family NAD(P)-dependent oxidoreductase [Bacilli bacterium]|nr:SDR family NAD(P)-dependent oxidoreductase [Bacilli bacterium]